MLPDAATASVAFAPARTPSPLSPIQQAVRSAQHPARLSALSPPQFLLFVRPLFLHLQFPCLISHSTRERGAAALVPALSFLCDCPDLTAIPPAKLQLPPNPSPQRLAFLCTAAVLPSSPDTCFLPFFPAPFFTRPGRPASVCRCRRLPLWSPPALTPLLCRTVLAETLPAQAHVTISAELIGGSRLGAVCWRRVCCGPGPWRRQGPRQPPAVAAPH